MPSRAVYTVGPPGGGLGRQAPADLWVLLGVLFATFSLQFFATTAGAVALLRLTPAVWQAGWLWQAATYGFAGWGGPSFWFVLELFILFWFGRDVFAALGRARFWRLVVGAVVAAAAVAVGLDVLAAAVPGLGVPPFASFSLMQGQRVLAALLVAAFAARFGDATILLMFVLPVRARWFVLLELVFAFLGFLATRDLPGFGGLVAAVAVGWYGFPGGRRRGLRRGLRERWLRLQQWWFRRRLDRLRRRRGLTVLPGGGGADRLHRQAV